MSVDNRTNHHSGAWKTLLSSGFAGGTAALVCFGGEAVKKKKQSGQPIPRNLRELYRGATPFAVSVTITTVASFYFNHFIQNLAGYKTESTWNQVECAVLSGAMSAAVGSTPVENIILEQQLSKSKPLRAIGALANMGPQRFFLGYPFLAFRESGFATVMFVGMDKTRQYVLDTTGSSLFANLSLVPCGYAGAALTQPADTVATRIQKSSGKISVNEAIVQIYREKGIRGYFAGLHARFFLFSGCAILIPRIEQVAKKAINATEAQILDIPPP